jgi:hypothetical protein
MKLLPPVLKGGSPDTTDSNLRESLEGEKAAKEVES